MKLSIIIIFILTFAFTGCILSDKHTHYHFVPKKPYKIYYKPIFVNGKPLNGGFALSPKRYPQYYYRVRVYRDGRSELDPRQHKPQYKPLTFKNGWYVE